MLWVSTLSLYGAYSRDIRGPIQELRRAVSNGLPCLAGHTPGYPGHWGAYINNYAKIRAAATYADIEAMLRDPHPVVRLVGAKIVLDRGLGLSLTALANDGTKLIVGPIPGSRPEFKEMTVSEVLIELKNDPLFELRPFPDALVTIDSIKEITHNGGSQFVIAVMPVYPMQMARAGLSGDVVAELLFNPGAEKPEVRILRSSQREFEEPVVWALARWTLKMVASVEQGSPSVSRYECHVQFRME